VGSIIASLACTLTDEELPNLFNSATWNLNAFSSLQSGSLRRKFWRLLKKGYLMDMKVFQKCVRENLGDVTFKEAYDKTKRILNITVASPDKFEFPRLLNYITAPNVVN
jgi:TAG lipase/lysophosphatidylethanolamine acyltransferase